MILQPYDICTPPTTAVGDDDDDRMVNITLEANRSPSGLIIGAFICELKADFKVANKYKILPFPDAFYVNGRVVCEPFCIDAEQYIPEEKGRLFSAVLDIGKQRDVRLIDDRYGTTSYSISREARSLTF